MFVLAKILACRQIGGQICIFDSEKRITTHITCNKPWCVGWVLNVFVH